MMMYFALYMLVGVITIVLLLTYNKSYKRFISDTTVSGLVITSAFIVTAWPAVYIMALLQMDP